MLRRRRAVTFAAAAGITAFVAIRGGSYETVARGELGLVLWAGIAFGLALGILPRGRLGRRELIPLATLATLAALVFLSLAWTSSDEQTYAELARVLTLVGFLVLPAITLNKFTWRSAAGGIAAGALAVSAFAVATRLGPGFLPADRVTELFGTDRLSYPFGYWNAVAAWSSMAAAMGLAWSAHQRSPWLRALALAAVPVAVSAIYLTYSRGGSIGLAVGALAVLVLSRNRWTVVAHAIAVAVASAITIAVIRAEPQIAEATGGAGGGAVAVALLAGSIACGIVALGTGSFQLDRIRLERRFVRTAMPVIALVAVVAGVAVGGLGALGDVWDEFRNERTVVASDDPAARLSTAAGTRSDVWDVAFDAFSDEPLTGIGPGGFEAYWSEHSSTPEYVRDAHSLYLEQMAELGLIGLGLVVAALAAGLWVCVRARSHAVRSADAGAAVAMGAAVVVFCVQAGLDWMWEMTAVAALALAALGVVLASGAERTGRTSIPRWSRMVAVVLAIAACVIQVPVLVSTARVRESAEAQSLGEVGEARQLADDAIEAEPWAATPYLQRAAVDSGAGRFGDAAEQAREAVTREPSLWRAWLALVQVELERGDRVAAQAAFDELERRSLASAVIYETLPQLDRDPVLEQAARNGCLAYSIGNCTGSRGAALTVSRCLEPPASAVLAVENFRGGPIDGPVAVESAVGTAPVWYLAAVIDGETATWSLDDGAYNRAFGTVVPLNDAATSLINPEALGDTDEFGVSGSDLGARAARECLASG